MKYPLLPSRKLCRLLPSSTLVALALGWGGSWTTLPTAAADETVPLVRAGMNKYGIEASIDGHLTLLTVDTGAPMTTLDTNFYQRNVPADAVGQIPAQVRHLTTLNNQPATTGWVQDLQAGSIHLGGGPVAVTNLYQVTGATSHDVHTRVTAGLLGADVLTKYGAVIDWSRRIVYFYSDPSRRSQIGRAAMSNGWTSIPMEFTSGRHFAVPCTLGSGTYHLIVDTGSGLTMIDKSVWGATDIMRGQPRAYMNGINGITLIAPIIIKNWSIGTFPMKNSPVGVGGLGGGMLNETTPSPGRLVGLLGSEWLAFRNAIIDINGMTLYLKTPGK